MTFSLATVMAKSFLLFSDAIVISPLLIFGFISRGSFFLKRPSHNESLIWCNACILVLFSMIFNVFLKSLFQIPLNPALGIKGFAFPSGHMQIAVVFYGWLICSYLNWKIRGIVIIVLFGIAFGLIQQGYHNIWDVLGAVMFGVATLYAYLQALSLRMIDHRPIYIAFILIPMSLIMMGMISIRSDIPAHIIKTFIGLVGFTITWEGFNRTLWKVTERY